MSYEPRLSRRVLQGMKGLPEEALDTLVAVMARVCNDPYDPVYSSPVPSAPGRRVADLGDSGFIEFTVDEGAGLVRVFDLVWTG